jgi:hypothetical protein
MNNTGQQRSAGRIFAGMLGGALIDMAILSLAHRAWRELRRLA